MSSFYLLTISIITCLFHVSNICNLTNINNLKAFRLIRKLRNFIFDTISTFFCKYHSIFVQSFLIDNLLPSKGFSDISNQQVHGVEVDTIYGRVRGKKAVSNHGRYFYSFEGIPYAAPPVGVNRFQVCNNNFRKIFNVMKFMTVYINYCFPGRGRRIQLYLLGCSELFRK